MSLFKKDTKSAPNPNDLLHSSSIPGSLAVLLWGFYKLGFFTKEQVKQFRDELNDKPIPRDVNEMIDDLDKAYEKVILNWDEQNIKPNSESHIHNKWSTIKYQSTKRNWMYDETGFHYQECLICGFIRILS